MDILGDLGTLAADAEAAVGVPDSSQTAPAADPAQAPAVEDDSVPGPLDNLAAAVAAVAPKVDSGAWAAALTGPMRSSGLVTSRRIAAFLGQIGVESEGLTVFSEDLTYSSAARILAVFGSHFSSEADAEPYVRNPEGLANRVYAGRLGNGNEASGDGYLFRGAGAIQVTGRTLHTALASAVGRDLASCPDWCRTPEGAAASACWWWCTQRSGMNALADAWEISQITHRVNGPAMEANAERIALSNAALAALGAV